MNKKLSLLEDINSTHLQNRCHTTVVLAMTADGKIADKQRTAARFGSANDRCHLEQQIALVDGVLFGAGTLRAYGTSLTITSPELLATRQQLSQPPQPVHIVVSASGKIDPQLRFFSQPVPRWLLTTDAGAKLWQGRSQRLLRHKTEQRPRADCDSEPALTVGQFERIFSFNFNQKSNSEVNWNKALAKFQQLGLAKLAILGGGELVASLFARDLIDELWLTICPLILGGSNAPTPVGGIGLPQSQGRKLSLLEVKQLNEEVFLHYLVQRTN